MKKKIRDFEGYGDFINDEDLANCFNVYTDKDAGEPYKHYNMNKTLVIKGIDNIPTSSFDYYEVQDGDTWNLISYKTYGTVQLWWLMCKANKITNALIKPKAGWMLRVIPKSMLTKIIKGLRYN